MNISPKSKPEWLRLLAIVLFVASFIPPGINAFLATPQYSLAGFAEAFKWGEWHRGVCAGALMIGWLANFTVFFRLPRAASWLAIASPWLPYFAMIYLSYSRAVEVPWPDPC